jgi:hypothetical protein
MSAHIPCSCGRKRGDHKDLVVFTRKGNRSAFNGGRWQHSDYSEVWCVRKNCRGMWRTKAAYVNELPDKKD